jgi:nucleoside-diphosphate-sugar epimerase
MPMLLITGGAGFIGMHITRNAIAQGWKVRVLDNLSTKVSSKSNHLEELGAEVLVGDVRDETVCFAAVDRCDAVVHLAAQISVSRSIENSDETYEINVVGTANLLKACKDRGVARFVMASSAAVYGNSDMFPLDEQQAGEFHSPYADSKWQNERQVMGAREDGMEAIALRLFNVYGTGQTQQGATAAVIPKFIECTLKHKPVTVYGNGLQTRDFVHVDDVSRAFLMLATEPWAEKLEHVYNVCTETEISMLELVSKIHNVLEDVAPSIPRLAPNHEAARIGDIGRSVGSNMRLTRDTAWRPLIEFERGLCDQILHRIQDV